MYHCMLQVTYHLGITPKNYEGVREETSFLKTGLFSLNSRFLSPLKMQ